MNVTEVSTTITTPTSDVCQDSSSQLECAERRLWQVIAPFIIVLGLLGNLMVVIVFSRLHFSKSSTLVHMFVLAITDSVILCVGPMRYWIINTFDYDVRIISSAGCKVNLFVLYTSLDFSAWILVSVTVERALVVLRPLHVRAWFTVRRTVFRLFIIFLCLSLLNGHYFFSNGLVLVSDSSASSSGNSSEMVNPTDCSNCSLSNQTITHNATITDTHGKYDCDSLTRKWEDFEEYTFVYIDLCFDSFIPFLIMATCNSVIIVYLKRNGKNRPRRTTRRELMEQQLARTNSDPLSIESNTNLEQELPETGTSTLSSSKQQVSSKPTGPQTFPLQRRNIPNNDRSSFVSQCSDGSSTSTEDFDKTGKDRDRSESETAPNNSLESANGTVHDMSSSVSNVREVGKRKISKTRGRQLSDGATSSSHTYSKHHSADRLSVPLPPQQTSNRRKSTPPDSTTASMNSKEKAALSGVTRMLILVTSVFFLTTLPSALYYIIDSYVRDDGDTRRNKILNVVRAVTNLLQYSNYGCNFLLYSSRSRRFRLEIKYMFGLVNSRFNRHFKSSVLSGTVQSQRQTAPSMVPSNGHVSNLPAANLPPHTHAKSCKTSEHTRKQSAKTDCENETIIEDSNTITQAETHEDSVNKNFQSSVGIHDSSVNGRLANGLDVEQMEMLDLAPPRVTRRSKSTKVRNPTKPDHVHYSEGLGVSYQSREAGTLFSSKHAARLIERKRHILEPHASKDQADVVFGRSKRTSLMTRRRANSLQHRDDHTPVRLFSMKGLKQLTRKGRKLQSTRSHPVDKPCRNCIAWRNRASVINDTDIVFAAEDVYEYQGIICTRQ